MIETKRVFISGPMSGIENLNREAFNGAETVLRMAGFSVFNPAWLDFDGSWDYKDIMTIDMAALSRCNYIYQLDGWENSQGSCAEWEFAKSAGINVVNKGWLDWYVKQVVEFKKTKEEPEFMTKCLNKPVKEPEKRCNTCEHYLGFYGVEGRAECSYYGYSLVRSDYKCEHYILKGENRDEEKEEVNEGKVQEVGQAGSEA